VPARGLSAISSVRSSLLTAAPCEPPRPTARNDKSP
jgi:hypothetical protein